MTCLLQRPDVAIHHADYHALASVLPLRDDDTVCDLLCVDAPYSEVTHGGHNGGMASVSERAPVKGNGVRDTGRPRRTLDYAAWGVEEVDAFIRTWLPLTRGWVVSITDDVLAPVWSTCLERAGRYVFAPLPFVARGSTVRLTGDGPPSWTAWLIVARPRRAPYSRWYRHHHDVPGAYVLPLGFSEEKAVVGGKPLWLLERLVEDYSRPGDIVCDPCCGAGTTVLAASRTGRIGIGGDVSREHAELAAARCGEMRQTAMGGLDRTASTGTEAT